MSETLHGIKRFEDVHFYLDRAAEAAQHYSVWPYQRRLIGHDFLWLPYSQQHIMCVYLLFVGLFQNLA